MVNSRNLDDLHPAVKRGALELIKRLGAAGYPKVGVSATYRDVEYQNYLYEQGRSRAGNIVTNARGGQSIHNYRLALDIFINIAGKEYSDNSFFSMAGRIWTQMGGVWGGSWTGFVDTPHFEYTGGLTLSQLQKGSKLADNAKMKWENEQKTEQKEEEVEVAEKRYDKFAEIPSWAQASIKKLMDKKLLEGDDKGNLNLTLDMIRMFVINDRAGLYGN